MSNADRNRPPKEVRDSTKLAKLVLERRMAEAEAFAREIENRAAARKG